MFSVEKISVAYATPTPPACWRSCAPLSSLWCAAPATIHSKSPKRSSLMIPTKPSGYSVPDALSEWSVKFWVVHPLANFDVACWKDSPITSGTEKPAYEERVGTKVLG